MNKSDYANSAEQVMKLLFKDEPSTLLITGNGFDLQCGLKSKYSDFFNWCGLNVRDYSFLKNAIQQPSHFTQKISDNKEITIWDLYFVDKTIKPGANWCDVEHEINASFQSNFWDLVFEGVNTIRQKGIYPTNREISVSYYIFMNDRHWPSDNWNKAMDYSTRTFYNVAAISKESFYEALFQELKIFEKRFGNYIDQEFKHNIKYQENQANLMNHIINATTKDTNFQVVTFNYTPCVSDIPYLNIHGTIESPIFGISNFHNNNQNARKFTKSFRRTNELKMLLNSFINNKENSLVFYGVSFSDLDFDHYATLIKRFGKKKIYFCYSNYDGGNQRADFILDANKMFEKLEIGNFYTLADTEDIFIVEINFESL